MLVGTHRASGAHRIRPVPSEKTIKYKVYAGKIDRAANGTLTYTPRRIRFAQSCIPVRPEFQHIQRSVWVDDYRTCGLDLEMWQATSLAQCESTSRRCATRSVPPASPPLGTRSPLLDKHNVREPAIMISALP